MSPVSISYDESPHPRGWVRWAGRPAGPGSTHRSRLAAAADEQLADDGTLMAPREG